MAKRLLDTSVLVGYWNRRLGSRAASGISADEAQQCADELIAFHDADAIATPVYVEFIAGARNAHELRSFTRFLSRFRIVDQGNIPAADWSATERLARRVPRSGKPRHLADCLIAAIAKRLKYEVRTLDKDFPKA